MAKKYKKLTMLVLNWLSKKCVATCAGSKLNNILLFDAYNKNHSLSLFNIDMSTVLCSCECKPRVTCSASMSLFSSRACACQRKSRRAVHSVWRACSRTPSASSTDHRHIDHADPTTPTLHIYEIQAFARHSVRVE